MSENITAIDNVEGQMDLLTGDVVEVTAEDTAMAAADVIEELVKAAFVGQTTITAYKIATIVNGTFKVLEYDKQIPTQMMYNYDRNGMIVKGVKSKKQFTKDEVTTFVVRYVEKYIK